MALTCRLGLPKYRASGPCAPGFCAGQGGRPPCGGTRFWRGRFRGGRMSGHFTSVERIDGGKLRCPCATWSDAVVIFPGDVFAFQNIERQAHALRANAPPRVWYRPPAGTPDLGEDDFDGHRRRQTTARLGTMPFGPLSDKGGVGTPISVRTISTASTAASCAATWDDAFGPLSDKDPPISVRTISRHLGDNRRRAIYGGELRVKCPAQDDDRRRQAAARLGTSPPSR
jgi:hypothetical protein